MKRRNGTTIIFLMSTLLLGSLAMARTQTLEINCEVTKHFISEGPKITHFIATLPVVDTAMGLTGIRDNQTLQVIADDGKVIFEATGEDPQGDLPLKDRQRTKQGIIVIADGKNPANRQFHHDLVFAADMATYKDISSQEQDSLVFRLREYEGGKFDGHAHFSKMRVGIGNIIDSEFSVLCQRTLK